MMRVDQFDWFAFTDQLKEAVEDTKKELHQRRLTKLYQELTGPKAWQARAYLVTERMKTLSPRMNAALKGCELMADDFEAGLLTLETSLVENDYGRSAAT